MRISIILDCADPVALAEFWQKALGYEQLEWDNDAYIVLFDPEKQGPVISLQRVPEPKTVKNRMHIDLHPTDLEAEVERLIGLGATRVSDDPITLEQMSWIVMQDPEGNEFCVCT